MELNEFVIHKTRWINGWSKHMRLGNINFKTYMCMKGMTGVEFDVLNAKSEDKGSY